jgi:excisionase family DNA binding protein
MDDGPPEDGGARRPSPRRRVSVQEAAPMLGVSIFMVRALIRQRRLPYYKVGRRIVLDTADLDAYLLRHRVEARDA